jgi:hypothetical protein
LGHEVVLRNLVELEGQKVLICERHGIGPHVARQVNAIMLRSKTSSSGARWSSLSSSGGNSCSASLSTGDDGRGAALIVARDVGAVSIALIIKHLQCVAVIDSTGICCGLVFWGHYSHCIIDYVNESTIGVAAI